MSLVLRETSGFGKGNDFLGDCKCHNANPHDEKAKVGLPSPPYKAAIPLLGTEKNRKPKTGKWGLRGMCTPVFVEAQEMEATYVPGHRNSKQVRAIQTTEYHGALTEKDILAHATTRKHLEDTMLSDISQPLKDKYCMIPCR